jgi:adenine-specific DNA-methyltransferase
VHEYLLVYALDPEHFKAARNRIPLTEQQAKIYKNPNNHPRGRWRGIPMTAQGYRPNQMYEIVTPAGVVHRPPEGRCWSMIKSEFKKIDNQNRIYFGKHNKSQPSVIRFLDEVEGFVPWTWWPHEEVGHTDEARKEIQGLFQTQTAFDTPKPTRLLERVWQIATSPGDLVLDSFAGSGTTGHAVLKLNQAAPDQEPRRFILVEIEPKIALEVTAERVRRVAEGYTKVKGGGVKGVGGAFRYCNLGEPLFDENGKVPETVSFADLARHVYFSETGEPLPHERVSKSPFLGSCRGIGIYLLYNGILCDKSANGGNVLTRAVLAELPPFDGPKIIYCAGCLLGKDRLQAERIIVRQIPYEIKVS